MQTLFLNWQENGETLWSKDPCDDLISWIIRPATGTDGHRGFEAVELFNLNSYTVFHYSHSKEDLMWQTVARRISQFAYMKFSSQCTDDKKLRKVQGLLENLTC